ncbi:MAG: biotin--[acetyl-CoA-carboxylase] ligase [Gammaproteobacteria bacterium]
MNSEELLALLADGEFHSGERLGAEVGMTRAAVWKQIRKLERWGLRVEAGSGRGYRLSQPIELLDAQRLQFALGREERFGLDRIDVFTEIDSTNRFLLDNPPSGADSLRVCFAEWQSAGRGRLERCWISPLGSGVCMSAAWTYEGTPRSFSAMSLAAGAAVAETIAEHCAIDVQLKWPNDFIWNGRKLGGVLVESRIESHGLCHVVVGVGINLTVSDDVLADVSNWRAGAVDLRTAAGDRQVCSRNVLASGIAAGLGMLLGSFDADAASSWLRSWQTRDYLRGKTIRVGSGQTSLEGTASGIDDDGALLIVDQAGQTQRVLAGDASVHTR